MAMQVPQFDGVVTAAADVVADMLFVPVFQDDGDGALAVPGLEAASGGWIAEVRRTGEFKAKLYEFFIVPAVAGWKARRIALVGAGKRADLTAERLRKVAAACGYTARLRLVGSAAVLVREGLDPIASAATIADGLCSAEFDSGTFKADQLTEGRYPTSLTVVAPGGDAAAVRAAVARGRLIGQAANQARTLANEPGNVLTPSEFATRVAAMGREAGLTVDVLDEPRLRELKMGLLLGVAQGSAEPARLVVLRYEPKGATSGPVIGLVGKGVTFDTGGISIKPAEGMDRMKDDMSGGAAVAAALCAIARLGGPHRVIGVIPMVENMPGGKAIRPGDVLTAASGTTVEITNTDAEGRLILADALWYAQQLGATHLVDVATLTGACMVALGKVAAGLMGTPDHWVETLRAVAHRAGDRVWPLPLFPEYREQLKSEIADMVNAAGGRGAGAITAAWFLRDFVKDDRPWAHLDIAGTAWSEERKAYQPKGATGSAVRMLIDLGMTAGR
jgi:leucyl aminopeptidase